MDNNITLRNYQEDCLNILKQLLSDTSCDRINKYVVLPTGTGKTEIFKRLSNKKVLVLENMSLLRDDIADRFSDVASDVLNIGDGIHLTENMLIESNCSIVVATIQTMIKDVDNISPDSFDIIVIDEFHHTKKDKRYYDIIQKLNYKLCIGFSATPPETSCIFSSDDKVYEMSIFEAWRDGWLMKPQLYHLSLMWDKSKLQKAFNDTNSIWTNDDITDALIGHAQENYRLILDELYKLNKCEKSVVYFSSVKLANGFAEYCNNKGYLCYSITNKTKSRDKEYYINEFESKRNVILSNVWCLSEGIDIPSMECIVLARPVNDINKYKQIAGRVLRPDKNKKNCIICDCIAEENDYLFQHTFITAYCMPNDYGYHINKDFYEELTDEINQTKDITAVADKLQEDFNLGYSLIKEEKLFDTDNHDIKYYLTDDKSRAIGLGKCYESHKQFIPYLGKYVYSPDYNNIKFKVYFYIDLDSHTLHILKKQPDVIKCDSNESCFKYLFDKYCKDNNIFSESYTHKSGNGKCSDKQLNYAVKLVTKSYDISESIAKKIFSKISKKEASNLISKLSIMRDISEYINNPDIN